MKQNKNHIAKDIKSFANIERKTNEWFLCTGYIPDENDYFIKDSFPSEIICNDTTILLPGKKLSEVFPDLIKQIINIKITYENPHFTEFYCTIKKCNFNVKIFCDRLDSNKILFHIIEKSKYLQSDNTSTLSMYNSILYDVPSVITIKDIEFKYISFNNAFLKLIDINTDNLIYKTDYDIFTKDTADLIRKTDEEIFLKHQSLKNIEEKITLQNNKTLWLLTTKKAIFDDTGKILGVLSISNDITELKNLTNQLINEKRLFQALLKNSTDHIYFKDRQSRFIRLSDAQIRRFNYDSEDKLLGKTDFDVFTYEHAKQAYDDEQKIMETGVPMIGYEEKETWPDGSISWVSSSKIPIYDEKGKIVGIFGISRDITEQKLAHERLMFTQFAVDNVGEAALWVNIQGKIIYANSESLSMLLYNKDEVKEINIYNIIPDFTETRWKAYWRLVKRHKKIVFETIFLSKENKKVPVEIISNFFEYENNEYNCIFARDISERKKTEEILRDKEKKLTEQNKAYMALNEQLLETNRRMQIINNELLLAKNKAEESDRLKTAFLANMSHEIRTPMNAIVGFADLLLKPGITYDKIEKYSKIININSHQLLSLINDIIDISKIESGQIQIYKKKTNINDILDELYNIFQPMAYNKNLILKIHKSLLPHDAFIITDETKFKQIFINLLNNALKFTSSGEINFGYTKKDDFIVFYVSDTGIGISPENYEIIFERFRQVDGSNTRKYGGAGLGLSISKALVELLGGKIWLESEENIGTTFYFTLPYRLESTDKSKTEDQKIDISDIDWKNKTILIVDDEEYNYFYLTEILKSTHASLLHANNGKVAIEICQNNPSINIVLMDIKMPIIDGYTATKEIKKFRPDLPIIAQTAYGMSDDRDKALNAGCDDYISKPLLKEKLIIIINKYINK